MLDRDRVVGFLIVRECVVLGIGVFCSIWGGWSYGLFFGVGCEAVCERV